MSAPGYQSANMAASQHEGVNGGPGKTDLA